MPTIKKFRIELHRENDTGSTSFSAAVFDTVNYETVQEAKRIYCRWLDSLLDNRTAEEKWASLDRRITGKHAINDIINGGNGG